RYSKFSYDWHTVWDEITHQRLYVSVFLRHIPNTQPQNIVNLSSRDIQEFRGQMYLLKAELSRLVKGEFSVVVVGQDQTTAEKIKPIFSDYEMRANVAEEVTLPVTEPTITIGNIRSGIELPLHKLVLITENELFKTRSKRVRKRQKI